MHFKSTPTQKTTNKLYFLFYSNYSDADVTSRRLMLRNRIKTPDSSVTHSEDLYFLYRAYNTPSIETVEMDTPSSLEILETVLESTVLFIFKSKLMYGIVIRFIYLFIFCHTHSQ